MSDTYVELKDIPVIRVKADSGKGPAAAMQTLESKLATLRSRRFYGIFRETPSGEEYYACVEKIPSDDPDKMQLDTGTIPGGRYARRRVMDWEDIVRAGRLPELYQELVDSHSGEFDRSRFSLEFYRSQVELLLFLPVHNPQTAGRQTEGPFVSR